MRIRAKIDEYFQLGDTALHWACRGGDLQIVKQLVDNGAKINAKDKVRLSKLCDLHLQSVTGSVAQIYLKQWFKITKF